MQQQKMNQIMQMLGISPSQGAGQPPQELPGAESTGTVGDSQQRINKLNLTQEQVVAASLMDPEFGKALSPLYQAEERSRSKREQAAEPELLKREERLGHLEESGMRFDRLEKLFSPELESKFPSALVTGLFTKDGELRPTAAAMLSPEAQEATKLIADELRGVKDTFGARISNFELQAYMKRLPTLLNTAEGRKRVLRDLKSMNEMNRFHDEKVLDIVDRGGGAGAISLSKAERIFRKEYSGQLKDMREAFINPEKSEFSQLPLPASYAGQKIVDEETGQVFRSDGKNWIPEGK
jgi:hypothetical protein